MLKRARIVILDRSLLAANMLRLLLAQYPINILAVQDLTRFAQSFEQQSFDVAILNSNAFPKDMQKVLNLVCDQQNIASTKKIFLCRNHQQDDKWREVLHDVPHAVITTRPFAPGDFHQLVGMLLYGGKTA